MREVVNILSVLWPRTYTYADRSVASMIRKLQLIYLLSCVLFYEGFSMLINSDARSLCVL